MQAASVVLLKRMMMKKYQNVAEGVDWSRGAFKITMLFT
jgi:hypothetical protein